MTLTLALTLSTASLAKYRQSFLDEVAVRAPAKYASTDFAARLDHTIAWSRHSSLNLSALAPGKQCTVRFGSPNGVPVLWAAYPRRIDGAKLSVLPGRFDSLGARQQKDLRKAALLAAPGALLAAGGRLEVPFHTIDLASSARALNDLLALAYRYLY